MNKTTIFCWIMVVLFLMFWPEEKVEFTRAGFIVFLISQGIAIGFLDALFADLSSGKK